MKQHFALELLTEYATQPLPDTQQVVNPDWRQLNQQRNSLQGKLSRRQSHFAALTLHPEPASELRRFHNWSQRKAELLEEIQHYENQLAQLKQKLTDTPHYLRWDQLPEEHQFQRLAPSRRHLIDTIRLIAYRAETAMVPLLTTPGTDSSDAQTLLQALFRSEADLLPDYPRKCLRVRLHRTSRPATDRRLHKLCDQLNQTATLYPGTDLTLCYELVPNPSHPP